MFFIMIKRIVYIILLAAVVCDAADSVSSIIAKSGKGKSRPDFSICFIDVASGKELYSYKAHSPLKPASNMKLVTTGAALDRLGGDFSYVTRYGMLGDDLVIIGSGDALSGDPEVAKKNATDIYDSFARVLQALKDAGINEIKGDLLIDNYVFDDIRFHESWPIEQANRWYEAQISGLNFNDNCVDIIFKPAKSGGKAIYELIPDTGYLQITNNCRTVRSGSTAVGAVRKYDSNEVTLIGKCRTAIIEPINVTVDRPAAFHGYVLAEYLLRNGIKLDGTLEIRKVTGAGRSVPTGFRELYTEKHSLAEVIDECNQRSQNMVAECVFKTVGAYNYGGSFRGPGSWESGRSAVKEFLGKVGVPDSEYKIDDGCGLSHDNRISASGLCKLLVYMAGTGEFVNYRESLSTPEVGTIAKKRRFKELKGRMYGKTGYISGANTLSGYVLDSNDRWIAFSVLTNSPAASYSTIDSIVRVVCK